MELGGQTFGHLVPEGHGVDRILCSQRDGGQEDEQEDDVGESCRIDYAMAELTKPGEKIA